MPPKAQFAAPQALLEINLTVTDLAQHSDLNRAQTVSPLGV
jgi:hypothetical protein